MPLSKDRNIVVPQEELDRQMEFCGLVHTVLETRLDGRRPLAYVHTFGCQATLPTVRDSRVCLKNGLRFHRRAGKRGYIAF